MAEKSALAVCVMAPDTAGSTESEVATNQVKLTPAGINKHRRVSRPVVVIAHCAIDWGGGVLQAPAGVTVAYG